MQQYILLIKENVTRSARFVRLLWMRYTDKVTPAMMVIVYLPQLTKCGKMFRVSL